MFLCDNHWKFLTLLNFEINVMENKKLFQKSGSTKSTKIESTKIENTAFPYKTTLSEANVKANKAGNKKVTYHKKRSFASNYFIFLKILFQFENLL